jgi:hypothetical protein
VEARRDLKAGREVLDRATGWDDIAGSARRSDNDLHAYCRQTLLGQKSD